MRALPFELQNTLIGRLSIDDALRIGTLSSSSSHSGAVDDEALLGLITQTTSFIRTSRARSTVDGRQCTQLPAANTKQKAQNVALFLLP